MKTGKCPKCEKILTHIMVQDVPLQTSMFGGDKYYGVTYQCPFCFTVLSASIDPLALRTEIVAQVVDALKGRR